MGSKNTSTRALRPRGRRRSARDTCAIHPFIMTRRAWAWARRKILDELRKTLEVQSRQTFDDREELAARVEGRTCRIRLWAREASIAISLSRPILPDGL